jgi:hypothetical protein
MGIPWATRLRETITGILKSQFLRADASTPDAHGKSILRNRFQGLR